jgi:hypothetical protein
VRKTNKFRTGTELPFLGTEVDNIVTGLGTCRKTQDISGNRTQGFFNATEFNPTSRA